MTDATETVARAAEVRGMNALIETLLIAYALRGAYTAGVIKSWLMWSRKPVDPVSIAWAGLTWPVVLYRGWRASRGR